MRTGFFQKRGIPVKKEETPYTPFKMQQIWTYWVKSETIYFSKFCSKKRKSSKKRKILIPVPSEHAKIVSMIRKYHNHKLQTTPWHREEEPLNHHETPGRQIKQSNQQIWAIIGTQAKHHLNGVLLADPWWPAYIGICLDLLSPLKQKQTKNVKVWPPSDSDKTFWFSNWQLLYLNQWKR